jgi:hypothetical protein
MPPPLLILLLVPLLFLMYYCEKKSQTPSPRLGAPSLLLPRLPRAAPLSLLLPLLLLLLLLKDLSLKFRAEGGEKVLLVVHFFLLGEVAGVISGSNLLEMNSLLLKSDRLLSLLPSQTSLSDVPTTQLLKGLLFWT